MRQAVDFFESKEEVLEVRIARGDNESEGHRVYYAPSDEL